MEEVNKTYGNHPSIKLIKDNVLSEDKEFTIELATAVKINKIIKRFNPKKATGPDKIPVKMVKLAINITDSHLTNITNNDLPRNLFSNPAKVQLNVLYRLQKYMGKDEKMLYQIILYIPTLITVP